MILTKDFVVINYPKTGSTYMRACIKKLYLEASMFNTMFHKNEVFKELHMPKIYGNTSANYRDQHGVVRQIPKAYQQHPIVTVTRNPIQRIESSYHFEWWKKNPLYDLSKIKEFYPTYPEIDLLTFAKMLNNPNLTPQNLLSNYAQHLGYNTRLFLVFYSKNPEESAEQLIQKKASLKEVVISDIHFLRQEHLQKDLMAYIISHTGKDAELITSVNDKNSGTYKATKQYSREFTEYVLQMEHHLFETFYPEVHKNR